MQVYNRQKNYFCKFAVRKKGNKPHKKLLNFN